MITHDSTPTIPPNGNETIYRYLSLEKFATMLERKAIFPEEENFLSGSHSGSMVRIE